MAAVIVGEVSPEPVAPVVPVATSPAAAAAAAVETGTEEEVTGTGAVLVLGELAWALTLALVDLVLGVVTVAGLLVGT